jgi:hypothetical protein
MSIIKILITGWVILIVAIGLNFMAYKLGILTWYSFLENIGKIGFVKSFQEISLVSKIFLFVIYPFLLGLSGYILLKYFK